MTEIVGFVGGMAIAAFGYACGWISRGIRDDGRRVDKLVEIAKSFTQRPS